MLDIVNIVGSGSLKQELDLIELSREIGQQRTNYNPDKYPAVYIRLKEDAPLIAVYRTGMYNITGASSVEEIKSTQDSFIDLLYSIGAIDDTENSDFSIKNYVCTGELMESLDLNTLALHLGLEKTEYEPEQFPGLVYRPTNSDVVLLLFSSGRVVITGTDELKNAEKAFRSLKDQLEDNYA